MEKKKLKLEEVRINSFITNIPYSDKLTIEGASNGCNPGIRISIETATIPGVGNCPVVTKYENNSCNDNCPGFTEKGAYLCDLTRDVIKSISEKWNNPNPNNQCSVFRKGSCGGTIGA